MSTKVTQPAELALPDQLRQRLGSLGITAANLSEDGHAFLHEPHRPLEEMVMGSPQLAADLKRCWGALCKSLGQALLIWPGLWLVPFPQGRRRRLSDIKNSKTLVAAVLIGHELLESEQFQIVCDNRQLDRAAVAAQTNHSDLIIADEAQRLAATLAWMQQDNVEIDRRNGELQNLSSQLGESYEELSLLYKFSTNMTVNQPPDEFLQQACADLQQTSGLRWLALQLIEDEPRLNELSGQFYVAGPSGIDPLKLKEIGRCLMLDADPGPTPTIVDDTSNMNIPHVSSIADQLLIVWLMREDRCLGILFGGDKTDGTAISSIDSKLCNSLANSFTIFLENVMLYEDMQAMFIGTLHALTAAVDAKDSYTHGHSERVAMMSRSLASAAGLEPHTVERVYISGLLHDVGKIGVPEAVLTKPGRLTAEEYALIKMHPQIGANIVQGIRQMQDLIPGVLYHHERWDGNGYPEGLAGENIPLFGRLLGMADAFDAMSSNRTYRNSLDRRKVIKEIQDCAGSQFDPNLVHIFVRLDFEPFYEMIDEHQRETARRSA